MPSFGRIVLRDSSYQQIVDAEAEHPEYFTRPFIIIGIVKEVENAPLIKEEENGEYFAF